MKKEIPKNYDPQEVEDQIYELWEKSGFFNPDNLPCQDGKPYTILMPPTNANGNLHAGHGLVMTIEDIMIRYKRMRGFRVLWVPGLDHAGFETQVVYEKQLEKEGRSRFEMTPHKLYQEILDFTVTNSSNIKSQVRHMGASCDWSREKFTLNPDIVRTVYQTFKQLYDDGMVYRGKRIVSWCTKHQTSFSDLEVRDEERIDKLYYLKYGPFVIATARPETKFGDKYVVMHPNDKRYAEYKDGQKLSLEWINGPITATVIKDVAIDMAFGTGVMTITPAHDATDFEIAERHGLEKEQIIDLRGKLLSIAGQFAGMSAVGGSTSGRRISEVREKIIEKLKEKDLVDHIDENYAHVVKTCYKCGTVIEPQIKNQWFVRMKPLAEKALEKIKSGEITYIPNHYQKISVHWLESIVDWNISRQIVWGISIPAKLCDACDAGYVDLDDSIKTCPKCSGTLRKDPDTFDTWFSSGQWPFATLGYPDSNDFKTYYPTDVLETAGEIIFFWVARMIMLSLYVTGKIPFKTVYLHGLVLDAKGQKMSKSKGNVINPLDLTDKFGTDAFRMGLVVGNTPGTSLALAENKIKGYKHFANKIWNIARYVLEKRDPASSAPLIDQHINEFTSLAREVTGDMDAYRFYLAAEKIYHYIWHILADKIIEESKADMTAFTPTLDYLLKNSLKLLHPFMPFITERIYQQLPVKKKLSIMIEHWPV